MARSPETKAVQALAAQCRLLSDSGRTLHCDERRVGARSGHSSLFRIRGKVV